MPPHGLEGVFCGSLLYAILSLLSGLACHFGHCLPLNAGMLVFRSPDSTLFCKLGL
jgi:hypothetical protein